MTTKVRCRAKEPARCRTHGTSSSNTATFNADEYLRTREEQEQKQKTREIRLAYIEDNLSRCDWGDYTAKVRALMKKMVDTYGTPKIGRTRAVFDMKDGNVLKVPFTDEGELANGYEYRAGQEEDPFIPVATNSWDKIDGVDVLVMEKVRTTSAKYSELPDWVGYVDSAQVGYDKTGKLVAYDL
jgi:hypothetical protein